MTKVNPSSSDSRRQARSAIAAALVIGAASALATVSGILVLPPRPTWQQIASNVLPGLMVVLAVVSLWISRQRRVTLASGVLLGGLLANLLGAALFSSGLGVLIGALALTLPTAIATLTLPPRLVGRTVVVSLVVGVAALLYDLYGPANRAAPSELAGVAYAAAGVLLLFFGVIIFFQFRNYSLRAKQIVLFLVVSLIPVGVMAYLNFQSARAALVASANQSLFTAANQTAAAVDDFIEHTRTSLRIDAQSPVLVGYMVLAPEARQASDLRVQVGEALRTLSSRDPVHISSYALFDANGVDLIDTYAAGVGQSRSERDFFQIPVSTKLPYVSPVEISESTGQPSLYFSAPVQSFLGVTLGVLRVRYDASVLQDLVANSSGLTGAGSAATLVDENYIRLASGADPDSLFKAYGPLDEATAARLRAARRLPDLPLDQLSTDLPDAVNGLNNARQQPFFTGEVNEDRQVEMVAVVPLTEQSWSVLYALREDVALAPVSAQSRSNILGALVIAILVAGMAVFTSQLLAGPVVRLTAVAERIRGGDFAAVAPVESADEIGALAGAFNSMTRQLRDTLQGLEQRVGDRTRALSASAQVSRRLSTILDRQQLLVEVVEQVKSAFNFYHAHIYLFDDRHENLLMAAGTGAAGASMLASGHSLPRGRGLVGRAAETNTVVLVPDVAQAVGWLPNPLLPDTRAEVAVPIAIGETVLGVLDVQHNVVGGLRPEDAELLRSIADQVAVALQNTRLYTQSQRLAQNESLVNIIGQKIQGAATVEEAMQVAVRELGRALKAPRTSVKLTTPVETKGNGDRA